MTAITARLYLIQIQPDHAHPEAWFTEGEAWTADAAMRWSSLLEANGITSRLVAIDLAGRLVGEPLSRLAPVLDLPEPPDEQQADEQQADEPIAEQADDHGRPRPEPVGRLLSTHRGRSPFDQPQTTEQPDQQPAEPLEPDTGPAAPQGPHSAPNPEPGTDAP